MKLIEHSYNDKKLKIILQKDDIQCLVKSLLKYKTIEIT